MSGNEPAHNIDTADKKQYDAWCLLFKNMTPNQIADKINGVYLDPHFKFVVVTEEYANGCKLKVR